MTEKEYNHFVEVGKSSTVIEEIELDEINKYESFLAMCPTMLVNAASSKPCKGIWDAFDNVITKMSNKKYENESKRIQSMNLMLFNELRKKGISIRSSI